MKFFISGLLLTAFFMGNSVASERILDFRLNYLPNNLEQHFVRITAPSADAPSTEQSTIRKSTPVFNSIINDPNNIALVVSEGGVIQFERYGYGTTHQTPLFVYSITKSFSALMLLKRLCEKGEVNLDQPMGKLSPRLQNTVYENVSIRNVLHMQSGNGKNFFKELQIPIFLSFLRQQRAPMDWIKDINSPDAKPGKYFWYNANDTNALGILLEDLSGSSIVVNFRELFTDKIQPQSAIYWMKTKDDQNPAAYGLMATGRDLIALASVYKKAYSEDECLKEIFSQIDVGNVSNGEYGFQVWRDLSRSNNTPPKNFYMKGAGGQIIAFSLDSDRIVFAYSINEKYNSGRIQDLLFN